MRRRRHGFCRLSAPATRVNGRSRGPKVGLNIVNKTAYPLSIGGSYHWKRGTKGNPQEHDSDFEYGPVNPGDSLFVILASSDKAAPYVTSTTTFSYAPDERWPEVLGNSRPPKQCANNANRYEVSPCAALSAERRVRVDCQSRTVHLGRHFHIAVYRDILQCMNHPAESDRFFAAARIVASLGRRIGIDGHE